MVCRFKSNHRARDWFFLLVLVLGAANLSSCKLYYTGEEFTLSITPDGAGALSVLYNEIGSEETLTHLRLKDLQYLKDLAQSPVYAKDAAGKGVTIKSRRLDFTDFSTNAYVEAQSKDYKSLFKIFTNYELEVADRIYITPLNGTVSKATLNENGEIVIRNKRYAFAWPKDSKEISFKASYRVTGSKFTYDNDGVK